MSLEVIHRSIGLLIGVGVLFMMHRGRQIRPPTAQSRRAIAQPEGSRTADCASSAYSSKKNQIMLGQYNQCAK